MLKNPNWKPAEVEIPLEDWQLILLKAANLLQQKGHAKFIQEDDQGSMCILGALSIAATGFPYCHDRDRAEASMRKVHSYLGKANRDFGGGSLTHGLHGMWSDLVEWNNKPERTGQDVIDALRGAADA